VGTPSHTKVRQFILNHFDTLGWHVELDSFTSDTPIGTKNFTNIIATQDPTAARRLVLAAHYDSMALDGFIGATDSSVPCALLLSLAESLNGILQTPGDVSLELVFFDGEEAMVKWSDSDSIYGAKHLASTWESKARLQSIDVLVLLDLMGTPNPTFHNYFMSTNWLFQHLANLETRLSGHWQYVGQSGQDLLPMFPTATTRFTFDGTAMSDDHLPFKDRGVNILHLIPYPFPNEWHTLMVSDEKKW
jgi:glutaminyl-peptide cyclotransferase